MRQSPSVYLRCQFHLLQRSLPPRHPSSTTSYPALPVTRPFSQNSRPSPFLVASQSLTFKRRKSTLSTRRFGTEAIRRLCAPQQAAQHDPDERPIRNGELEGDDLTKPQPGIAPKLDGEDIIEETLGEVEKPPEEESEADLDGVEELELSPEQMAHAAKQRFGEQLPTGLLNEDEYRIYERNYGPPLRWVDAAALVEEERMAEGERSILLREGRDGELEEVEVLQEDTEGDEVLDTQGLLEEEVRDTERVQETAQDTEVVGVDMATAMKGMAMERLQASDRHQLLSFNEDLTPEADEEDATTRTHPFTQMARFRTNPSTVFPPKDSVVTPIQSLLSNVSNKHIDEAAERTFGGPQLPYGTGTPAVSRTMLQKPIPLTSTQSKMTSMEADVFMAVLVPGMYATATSAMVEVRKRLGSGWIQRLFNKPGGPRMLDVGGAGAAILAWREVLRAEWESTHSSDGRPLPHFMGKATVITGSQQLQRRSSALLENTTFLPRMPDYVNDGLEEGTPRKQFDVIVASHSLWHLQEEHQRKAHVENLWSLLNDDGGVLILLEKGVPRGFEVIASAREQLLDEIFAPPAHSTDEQVQHSNMNSETYPGAIIAPCTTHSKCPMYPTPGISRQRKDYCHFTQRYIRPPFYQRILDAKDRNHEDAPFSYVAVQKGSSPEELLPRHSLHGRNPFQGRRMDQEARDRAFEGYETTDPDIALPLRSSSSEANPHLLPNPHSLPRLILPPLKRHGHVLLDVCTPAGSLERWTVPRSFGKQAYRDARKAQWGDLWALGAETSVKRNVRLGKGSFAARDAGVDAGDAETDDSVSATTYRNIKNGLKEDEKGLYHRDVFLTEGQKMKKVRGREKNRRRKRAERKVLLSPRKAKEKMDEDEDED